MAARDASLLILGIAALGVGAYFLGRRLGRASLPGQDLASRAASWSALSFDVDVFPAGASRMALDPPPTEGSVSVSPSCDVVAVGHGWWSVAIEEGFRSVEEGLEVPDAVESLVSSSFPLCAAIRTPAMASFRAEIFDRLRQRAQPSVVMQIAPASTMGWP